MLLARKGKIAEAISHWTQSLEIEPRQASAHQELGMALVKQGKIADAVSHLKETIRLSPNRPEVLNNLGWILATFKDSRVYNPKGAVRFAENACALVDYKDTRMLDTLSAAYASAGRFEEAIATAQKAVDLALSSGREAQAKAIRKRLELYKAGKPYVQP
jgi:superkiller protein 3